MDSHTLMTTRRTLHGLAELLLAGPQYAAGNGIRLRPVPGGFATVKEPDVRVDGVELVTADVRVPIRGTYADLGRELGVRARPLNDVYADGPGISPDDIVDVEPEAAALVADAFALAPRPWPASFRTRNLSSGLSTSTSASRSLR